MKKIFLLSILLLIPLISAGAYGAGPYGSGVYGIGYVAPVSPTSPDGSSPSSPSCTYDWNCTNWFPVDCPISETQERICINKGTCTGTIGMPDQIQTCIYDGFTEPLFDIFLKIPQRYKKICAGNKIKAKINLKNLGKIELLDAFMTYWVINQNNALIAEIKDTRAITDKLKFDIEIQIPQQTPFGDYRLYAQINYAEDKIAIAGESFEITDEATCKSYSRILTIVALIIGLIIIMIIIIIILLLKRRKAMTKVQNNPKR